MNDIHVDSHIDIGIDICSHFDIGIRSDICSHFDVDSDIDFDIDIGSHIEISSSMGFLFFSNDRISSMFAMIFAQLIHKSDRNFKCLSL